MQGAGAFDGMGEMLRVLGPYPILVFLAFVMIHQARSTTALVATLTDSFKASMHELAAAVRDMRAPIDRLGDKIEHVQDRIETKVGAQIDGAQHDGVAAVRASVEHARDAVLATVEHEGRYTRRTLRGEMESETSTRGARVPVPPPRRPTSSDG